MQSLTTSAPFTPSYSYDDLQQLTSVLKLNEKAEYSVVWLHAWERWNYKINSGWEVLFFLSVGKKISFTLQTISLLLPSTFSSWISHLFHVATAAVMKQKMHTTATIITKSGARNVFPGEKQYTRFCLLCTKKWNYEKAKSCTIITEAILGSSQFICMWSA